MPKIPDIVHPPIPEEGKFGGNETFPRCLRFFFRSPGGDRAGQRAYQRFGCRPGGATRVVPRRHGYGRRDIQLLASRVEVGYILREEMEERHDSIRNLTAVR